eukprot:Hpha_TRINITY_DN27640_c0_g1::TRINITY_DN27640_c0_g1_i1::g.57402::m.57402
MSKSGHIPRWSQTLFESALSRAETGGTWKGGQGTGSRTFRGRLDTGNDYKEKAHALMREIQEGSTRPLQESRRELRKLVRDVCVSLQASSQHWSQGADAQTVECNFGARDISAILWASAAGRVADREFHILATRRLQFLGPRSVKPPDLMVAACALKKLKVRGHDSRPVAALAQLACSLPLRKRLSVRDVATLANIVGNTVGKSPDFYSSIAALSLEDSLPMAMDGGQLSTFLWPFAETRFRAPEALWTLCARRALVLLKRQQLGGKHLQGVVWALAVLPSSKEALVLLLPRVGTRMLSEHDPDFMRSVAYAWGRGGLQLSAGQAFFDHFSVVAA